MNIEHHLRGFNADLHWRGLNPVTCSQHVASARELLEWLAAHAVHRLEDVNRSILDAHVAWLWQRPNRRLGGHLSVSTIRGHVLGLRSFFAWLERSGVLTENPASTLALPTMPPVPARVALTADEIARLRARCQNPTDRALLAVFYGCGLRRAEGAALDTADVDVERGLLHVRRGKGGKPRSVPMSAGVQRDLADLLWRHRPDGQTALFVNLRGDRLSANRMYALVKQLARRARITSVVTLHGLRHAVATHLLQRGLTLEQVRDFLGHSSIEATRIYTHGLPAEPQE